MMPYSSGLILDNANNYGIVKTETVFGFVPPNHTFVNESFNEAEPVEWVFKPGSFERRSLQETPRTPKKSKDIKKIKTKRANKARKPKRKGKGKINKCIYKVVKEPKRNKRRRNRFKMPKKMMMPLILGLLAAKSILVPIALKAVAFMSVKGINNSKLINITLQFNFKDFNFHHRIGVTWLMMGFFSTVMASILSLKGFFDNSHLQNRKDDSKTQVEIIQVPSKSEDHVYYDEHYRRGDMPPMMMGHDHEY